MDKDCKRQLSSRDLSPTNERASWRPDRCWITDVFFCQRSVVSHSERKRSVNAASVTALTAFAGQAGWLTFIEKKRKNMRPPSVGRTVHSRDKEIKELRELKRQWHGFKRSFQGLRNRKQRKWKNKASHIALSPTILYRSRCVCSFWVIYIQYKLQGWMNEKLSAVPAKDKREKTRAKK